MKRLLPLMLATLLVFSSACRDESGAQRRDDSIDVPQERLESATAQQRGRALFLAHCALCHGEHADGRGERREGFERPPRDFTSADWRREASPRRIYTAIRDGVRGTAMPAWKTLDADQTWDLVAYLMAVSENEQ